MFQFFLLGWQNAIRLCKNHCPVQSFRKLEYLPNGGFNKIKICVCEFVTFSPLNVLSTSFVLPRLEIPQICVAIVFTRIQSDKRKQLFFYVVRAQPGDEACTLAVRTIYIPVRISDTVQFLNWANATLLKTKNNVIAKMSLIAYNISDATNFVRDAFQVSLSICLGYCFLLVNSPKRQITTVRA